MVGRWSCRVAFVRVGLVCSGLLLALGCNERKQFIPTPVLPDADLGAA